MKNTGLTILIIIVASIFLLGICSMIITPIKESFSNSITNQYLAGGVYDNAAIERYSSIYGIVGGFLSCIPIAVVTYVDIKIWKRHLRLQNEGEKEK